MTTSSKKQTGNAVVGFIIFLVIVGFIIAGIASLGSSDDTTTKSAETADSDNSVAIAQTRQNAIDRFSPLYCSDRQTTKVVLSESGVSDGWPSNDGSGWSNEECVTIISKLYDSGATEEELQLVIDNKYAIGMLEMSLLYSLGSPSDINRTQFSGYVSAQYVYGSTYIYAENGKVTSVQN